MINRCPLNINTETAEIYIMNEPLIWHGYSKAPLKIIVENTGFDGTVH